jgi:hypothetical protein
MVGPEDPEVVRLREELAAAELRAESRAQLEANEAEIETLELETDEHSATPLKPFTPLRMSTPGESNAELLRRIEEHDQQIKVDLRAIERIERSYGATYQTKEEDEPKYPMQTAIPGAVWTGSEFIFNKPETPEEEAKRLKQADFRERSPRLAAAYYLLSEALLPTLLFLAVPAVVAYFIWRMPYDYDICFRWDPRCW